jgi:hypothetical protein
MPDNTPLNGVAPAVGNPPQFQAEYWNKIPRLTVSVVIHKVRDLPETGEKEFFATTVGGDQMRFRRKIGEINQLVMPGTPANIELIQNELITGMYLPDVKAWVFRMTAQDLADYTKEISGHLHAQRLKARELMIDTMADELYVGLAEVGLIDEDAGERLTQEYRDMARHLALLAIAALESGPQQGEK